MITANKDRQQKRKKISFPNGRSEIDPSGYKQECISRNLDHTRLNRDHRSNKSKHESQRFVNA